jgi:hypothetical protein
MGLGPRPGGGGGGEANTASTLGGENITAPKSGSNLPFYGPSAPTDSDIQLTPQTTLIEHDIKSSPKNALRNAGTPGLTIVPTLTIVDGATTFDRGAGEAEFYDYSVNPPKLETVTIPAQSAIPIVHTGSRVVWLSFSYNFGTSTLTMHQDLTSPGINLGDGKVLWANMNYRDGAAPPLDVLEFGTLEPYTSFGNHNNVRALLKAQGGIRIEGLSGSANVGNLSVDIDAGVVSRIGGNINADPNNPWQITTPALAAPNIRVKYANTPNSTANYSATQFIDPTVYSDGTNPVAVPGSDPWTIYIFTMAARTEPGPIVGTTVIAFMGETLYKTEQEAIDAATTNSVKWTEGPDTETAAPAFFCVVERSMTDLTTATFIQMPDRRGTGGTSGVGAAGYSEVQNAGTPLPAEDALNFLGGWTIVDDPANNRTNLTPPASTLVSAFGAQLLTSQTINLNAEDTVLYDNEIYDIDNEYDPLTGVFTAKRAGRYNFSAGMGLEPSPAGGGRLRVRFLLDDGVTPVQVWSGIDRSTAAEDQEVNISGDIELNIGDKVSVDCRWNFGAANATFVAHPACTFSGSYKG